MKKIKYINENGDFALENPNDTFGLYLPMASEKGLKSVITPDFSGDSKLDQNHFLLEPESVEDLRKNEAGRNFWIQKEDGSYWSAFGRSAKQEAEKFCTNKEKTGITAGFMWQEMERTAEKEGLYAKVLSFVPYNENVEICQIEIKNISDAPVKIRPVAAIPIYGRSADNLRDHRHVTSLLHRIYTSEEGVLVKPTLSFDERGHQKNTFTYFVCGMDEKGKGPDEFYPTNELFLGNGTHLNPESVAKKIPGCSKGESFEGQEAMGAFSFPEVLLDPGHSTAYLVLIGLTENHDEITSLYTKYEKPGQVEKSFEETKAYWQEAVNIKVKTGNQDFDALVRWVCFQPILRRIYGCSFLPHHDYGKGGRGWRDLWQDCLALLIMNPSNVREMILSNFKGVRPDGTNATIIGAKQGEFLADRNGITRVWMDHGMWPFLTSSLYIEQTGDLNLLLQKAGYFSDRQVMRGKLLLEADQVPKISYQGTILEHLILQHVSAICDRGQHGMLKLRDADWNDALDMAGEKGESVAFSFAYAGNLAELATYVMLLPEKAETEEVELEKNLALLIENISKSENDQDRYFEEFLQRVSQEFGHESMQVKCTVLSNQLMEISKRLTDKIQESQWIQDAAGHSWFNSYYDNHGNRVEGQMNGQVRMMLTGQVFAIMSGIANDDQIKEICSSADTYLYDETCGGYRLNTDFREEKYDMGRAFGFAYGHKENGAVFSHMAVMYAYALYSRGYVKEGYKALNSLTRASMNFEKSRIYPGIPEYFDGDGRGLYHYLTGAASWYALTLVTKVFGIHGSLGDLCLEPRLLPSQLSQENRAEMELVFAGKKLAVSYQYQNAEAMDEATIKEALLDGKKLKLSDPKKVSIKRQELEALDESMHTIEIFYK